jgi:SAM-dependent methyltransferase
MTRTQSRIRTIKRIFAAAKTHTTAEFLKQVPAIVQGFKFGKETAFPKLPNQPAKPVEEANPLLAYYNAHAQGNGIWKWMHYFDIYHNHFKKFIGREVHIMEVGIYSGGSLAMWKNYFGPGCKVYGVDIEEACLSYQDDNTKVFIGDQEDRGFWARVRQAAPSIDILIDDGGHHPEQQRVTLEEMLPHLRSGGVYLCEDIHGDKNLFASFVYGLASNLNSTIWTKASQDVTALCSETNSLQKSIRGVYLYPLVAVIEKRDAELQQLIAPKRGTKWQPFL